MRKKIRYAVVGLGHIAQAAVLPAFEHASENSELVALISGDQEKLRKLGKKYSVDKLYEYSQYKECLKTGDVDAVYICTPNTLHHDFAKIAAEHGVHVLCEKPMATTESDCLKMIDAAYANHIKLMIAYRLHFEPANLHAVHIASTGKLGELKVFNSLFSMQVRDPNNIRMKSDLGGGPLWDIGIYCINAARYLFRDEPIEVFAFGGKTDKRKFREVNENVGAVMKFPGGKVASLSISFGAADAATYDLVGTKGRIHLDNAYDYSKETSFEWTHERKFVKKVFPVCDQFAPELIYFSNCILKNKTPEPSGLEGLADVKIIRAIQRSMKIGAGVVLEPIQKSARPSKAQKITRPPVRPMPKEIHASGPRKAG